MKPSEAVKEFHEKFKIPNATIDNQDALFLRLKLITEEYEEVCADGEAILFDISLGLNPTQIGKQNFLKELADLVYVIYGTAETFGFNLDEAFNRVHTSNMTKLGSDGTPVYRADGKVMKSENYKEPYLGDLV